MSLTETTPRKIQMRPDRSPGLGGWALYGFTTLVGVVGLILVLGLILTRVAGTQASCKMLDRRAVLGVDGFDVKYTQDHEVRQTWGANWDKDAFSKVTVHTPLTVYLSPVLPNGSLVVAPNGSPSELSYYPTLMGTGLVSLLLLLPLAMFEFTSRRQAALVRNGMLAPGAIVRHKPYDRSQKGKALFVWFEFTPKDSEQSVEARMQVNRKAYRALQNRQKVSVLYGPTPAQAIIYDVCSFEIAPEVGILDPDSIEVALPDPAAGPLSEEMNLRHGSGPTLWRYWGYLRSATMGLVLAAPLWGFFGYGLKPSGSLTISVGGVIFLAPWLVGIVVVMVGAYAINQTYVRKYLKAHTKQEADHTFDMLAYSDFAADDIDDPVKQSLKKSRSSADPM